MTRVIIINSALLYTPTMFKVDFKENQLQNVVIRKNSKKREKVPYIKDILIDNVIEIEKYCKKENLDIWDNVKFKEAFRLLKTMECN